MALADSGTLLEAPGVKRSGSFLVNIHFFANYKKLIHIQTSKSQPKKEVSRNGCGENHGKYRRDAADMLMTHESRASVRISTA